MSLVLVEKDAGVVTVTLNRPDKLNALTSELLTELGMALHGLVSDPELRCVILTGAGDKAFAAGSEMTVSCITSRCPTLSLYSRSASR